MTKTNVHFRLKTKTKSKIAAKINTVVKVFEILILFCVSVGGMLP